jgi:hypothetical protein
MTELEADHDDVGQVGKSLKGVPQLNCLVANREWASGECLDP